MGVETDNERVTISDVAAHPFDLVGIHVGHGHFDGVRQIKDHFVLRGGLPDLHHRFGDLFRERNLSGAKTLWRILQHDLGAF